MGACAATDKETYEETNLEKNKLKEKNKSNVPL